MKQKSILLVLALLSYLTGAAQVTNRQLPVAGDQLTLEECQQLAQENYPLLKRYNLIQQTTEYSLQNINRGYLPQLVFSGQATYQSDVATLPELLTNLLAQNGYAVKGWIKINTGSR